MADFWRLTQEQNKQTTLKSGYVPEIDPYVSVETLDGTKLRIPRDQLPEVSNEENYNVYRYTPSGATDTAMSGPNPVQIFLTRGTGSGQLSGPPYLRMEVYNSSSTTAATFLPVPLWFQFIQYFSASGAPMGQTSGQGWWNNLIEQVDEDKWAVMAPSLLSNKAYGWGTINPLETKEIYVPMIGNPLSPGKFFIPGTTGDFQVLFQFNNPSVYQLSGPTCTVTQMSIETIQSQLPEMKLRRMIREAGSFKHSWFFPYERIQTLTQNWTAGQQYQITLSSIQGDVTFIRIELLNSTSGLDLTNPVPIESFQFLGDGGQPISSNNVTTSEFNRTVQQMDWFKGRASVRNQKIAYLWSKHKDGAIDLIMFGRKYGSYPFNNKQSVVLTMAGAGTNEQVLINATSAPTSGFFQLQWTNPDMGMTYVTQTLAYNATAATVETAINDMPNFTGTCTVTGTDISTGFTVTFDGGGYQNRVLNNNGFCLSIATNSLIGTTYTVGANTTLNQSGVAGITSGNSYQLRISAYTTSIGHLLPDGTVTSQNSGSA